MPHADEALRALFDRFRKAPGTSVSGELAEALLIRGHATESLRIAEHGLQLSPADADGRVHRASALLALSRPKVAYVELMRALAVAPEHRKALRLLGKVFVEAGAPARAAALLRQRHEDAVLPPQSEPPPDRTDTTTDAPDPIFPPPPGRPTIEVAHRDTTPVHGGHAPPPLAPEHVRTEPPEGSPIPELFASLTQDLGLGPVPNDFAGGPIVEVTQVIRARLKPRTQRPDDELSSIEGPIVDNNTSTGRLQAIRDMPSAPAPKPRRPSSVYDVVTSPEFHITIDDEPLFEESMPFAVRPVNVRDDAETIDDTETVNDSLPDRSDLELLRRAIETGAPTVQDGSLPPPVIDPPPQGLSEADAREQTEPSQQDKLPPAPDLPYLRRYKRPGSSAIGGGNELRVVRPKPSPAHWALAALGILAAVAFVVALGWMSADTAKAWLDDGTESQLEGSSSPPEKVSPGGARADGPRQQP